MLILCKLDAHITMESPSSALRDSMSLPLSILLTPEEKGACQQETIDAVHATIPQAAKNRETRRSVALALLCAYANRFFPPHRLP